MAVWSEPRARCRGLEVLRWHQGRRPGGQTTSVLRSPAARRRPPGALLPAAVAAANAGPLVWAAAALYKSP